MESQRFIFPNVCFKNCYSEKPKGASNILQLNKTHTTVASVMTAQWLNKELQRLVPHCKHQVNNYRLVEIALWELWKQGKDMQQPNMLNQGKVTFKSGGSFMALMIALVPPPPQGRMAML